MPAKLTKFVLDIGMVTDDAPAALAFFRDLLGFTEAGSVPFPGVGTVRRLSCGETTFRILELERAAPAQAHAGAFTDQTGLRYLTLEVANLDELVAEAVGAGYPNPVPPRELRPGVRVAQIGDGRGITVELMQIGA
ncbi:Glyoxalase/Bleomycin resistance protein/Dioxygenase superfamily protein [Sphingomonas laterariae]|uniref:Glyoxalase/Bleomycin resistance protein/Dioxygenase superfamily protein n=1 Tax=Edaphosphingomonas laterariae TaxID=861865 RepID=A0A239C789_9SPHN|nr:VOC family protein [Sphingomonas laterariae]SNS16087.1 Glyoxalase/Bleomycin resistance protein/Dioxygenase superfamily protein [Sphingomonas laterariae]